MHILVLPAYLLNNESILNLVMSGFFPFPFGEYLPYSFSDSECVYPSALSCLGLLIYVETVCIRSVRG